MDTFEKRKGFPSPGQGTTETEVLSLDSGLFVLFCFCLFLRKDAEI